MSYEIIEGKGRPIKAWTKGVPVDDGAKQQLCNLAGLPFIFSHIAVMPDVHWGMGATVGSVIATKGAIVPAAVGVDIGCGMMAQRTTLTANDLPDNLEQVRLFIEESIPHGRTHDGGANDKGSRREPLGGATMGMHMLGLKPLVEKYPELERAYNRAPYQAGTLGTGNHFIEVCLDEENIVWVMLHSGSRGIGNRIGNVFIERAKREMERWFITLPDKDLAYITEGSELFGDYWKALDWAQSYARFNRELMMYSAISALKDAVGVPFALDKSAVNCHHNYVNIEHHFGQHIWVTRKGAVDAHRGVLGIIPGSMGAKSFIVRGKGNPDSFMSCSHGAGRVMSRGEARRKLTLEDLEFGTMGVECRKDADVLDESPQAYKSIDAVMAAQADLVDVVHTLKQVVCVKG